MDLEEFRAHCLTKPRVTEGTPFGEDVLVFKVGGKMFALASLDQVPPQTRAHVALDLRDRYEEIRPGYHMNKKHWNTVVLSGRIPAAELRRMIDHSYALIVASLPKKRRQKSSA